jgi:ribosomal protein S18 acetylase RimI-like enzyme
MERVRRLAPERIGDFFRLHCDERGHGWCACVAWWVPTWEGWGERSAAENRRLREDLFARGELDGYLLVADGDPIAWCQAGPRDRLAKLVRQLERQPPDPGAWALSCFLVAPEHRGRGVAARLLDGVLADLPARGARRVEAYPRRDETLAAGEQWTGPAALFRRAGFREVAAAGSRLVMARELAPPS